MQTLQVYFQPSGSVAPIDSPVLLYQLGVGSYVVTALPVLQEIQLLEGFQDVLRHHHGSVADILHTNITPAVSQDIQYLLAAQTAHRQREQQVGSLSSGIVVDDTYHYFIA